MQAKVVLQRVDEIRGKIVVQCEISQVGALIPVLARALILLRYMQIEADIHKNLYCQSLNDT